MDTSKIHDLFSEYPGFTGKAQPMVDKMKPRLIPVLVLICYGAILIKVVVFKGALRLPEWADPGRDERAGEGRPGGGRGAQPGAGAAEGRRSRKMRPAGSALGDTRLSASRFAPIHANYVPFKTIAPQLRGRPRWSSAIINLVGNTVLFAPIGFLVSLVQAKLTWGKALVVAVAVGITMEALEGVFRVGIVDVDDVVLNASGVMGGYWLCRFWARHGKTMIGSTTS